MRTPSVQTMTLRYDGPNVTHTPTPSQRVKVCVQYGFATHTYTFTEDVSVVYFIISYGVSCRLTAFLLRAVPPIEHTDDNVSN